MFTLPSSRRLHPAAGSCAQLRTFGGPVSARPHHPSPPIDFRLCGRGPRIAAVPLTWKPLASFAGPLTVQRGYQITVRGFLEMDVEGASLSVWSWGLPRRWLAAGSCRTCVISDRCAAAGGGASLLLCSHMRNVAYSFGKTNMSTKSDVWQGTLALMVLKTLNAMGPQHGYGIRRAASRQTSDGQVVHQSRHPLPGAPQGSSRKAAIASTLGRFRDNNRRAKFFTGSTKSGPRGQLGLSSQSVGADDLTIISRFPGAKKERNHDPDAAPFAESFCGGSFFPVRHAEMRNSPKSLDGAHPGCSPTITCGHGFPAGEARRCASLEFGLPGIHERKSYRDQARPAIPRCHRPGPSATCFRGHAQGIRVFASVGHYPGSPSAIGANTNPFLGPSMAVLLQPLPYPESDRLVVGRAKTRADLPFSSCEPGQRGHIREFFSNWAARSRPQFESIGAYQAGPAASPGNFLIGGRNRCVWKIQPHVPPDGLRSPCS